MSTADRDRDVIQAEQGWTTETMLELVLRFVDEEGLGYKLEEYLEALAAVENNEAEE
jgi:hypothetical protein